MDYTEAALDFLAQEENLIVALEIADLVEQLRPKLHKEFWSAFYETLQDTRLPFGAAGSSSKMRTSSGKRSL